MSREKKAFHLKALRNDSRGVIVEATGFLDAHTVMEFENQMAGLLDGGATRIALDLGQLNYISSAGIGALMGLAQRARREEGDLVLLHPSQKVFRILDLLGFTEIFKIADTEEEALAQLQGKNP